MANTLSKPRTMFICYLALRFEISSLAKKLVLECFYRVRQDFTIQVLTGRPCRLEYCRHRALAMRNSPVCAVSVDLVTFKLGSLFRSRIHNHPSTGIYLTGHIKCFFATVAENLYQHFNNIIVGMIVIVEQDDIVLRNKKRLSFRFFPRFCFNFRESNRF